jgi:hypothetical protein
MRVICAMRETVEDMDEIREIPIPVPIQPRAGLPTRQSQHVLEQLGTSEGYFMRNWR